MKITKPTNIIILNQKHIFQPIMNNNHQLAQIWSMCSVYPHHITIIKLCLTCLKIYNIYSYNIQHNHHHYIYKTITQHEQRNVNPRSLPAINQKPLA